MIELNCAVMDFQTEKENGRNSKPFQVNEIYL